jgi:prolyl oligopeptidase
MLTRTKNIKRLLSRVRPVVALLAALSILASGLLWAQTPVYKKPPPTRTDNVKEVLHGVEIVDPYRWLEDQWSPETRAWIEAQNEYTDSILGSLPGREQLERRLSELMKIETIGMPTERGGRYFYRKRRPDQDLFVYYVRDGLNGTERVLLDPHGMSPDNTVSVNIQDISRDGKLVVYGIRQGGEDEIAMKMLDVDSGSLLPDSLPKARYYGISLKPDKSGYYYTRREEEGPRLYYRPMGSGPDSEKLIFGEKIGRQQFINARVSDDGRWLLITVTHGWSKNELYLQDLAAGGEIVPVVTGVKARFSGRIEGGRLFIQTNWQAPNGRLLVTDPKNPAMENWREIIPESPTAVLQSVSAAGGKLFARYLENVQSRIVSFDVEGNRVGEIRFESIGTVSNMSGRWDSKEAFFTFSSFHIPPTIYRYDVESGEKTVWARTDVPIDSDAFEVKQVWYESKDGTRVPMFIVHAKGLKLDGNNPTLLTGYGGFNISLTPRFSATAVAWIESGGVYAVANLRGGGEFGEEWHRAGMLENKQNVFDDFIAAAEYLINQKYTRPERLAIRGGSNGGLLVMAAMTQRPDLFGAIICAYPLIDMLRYHKFLVGATWIPEYGSADDPEQFKFIYAYSPYQRVKPGTEYPAVLFVTGDSDTRVDPLHARKMAARLQAATGSDRPILLSYDTKSGHSGGRPVSKQIEELTKELGFLFWQLGVTFTSATK